MADPTPSAAPSLAPTAGILDLSDIDKRYDPQIEAERKVSQERESQAVSAAEEVPREAEAAAQASTADEQEMLDWVKNTPTRQAAYASAMHAAPMLAILTAVGGKVTRLNGQQLLAATHGIVSGLNAGAEAQYADSMKAWEAAYERMREHHQRLMDAHRLMLTAYQGRADAYQKAADAARRLTGDLLDEKQIKVNERINSFKAQEQAMYNLDRIHVAQQANDIRLRDVLAKEAHWKELERRAANNPELMARLKVEQAKWRNKEAQYNLKLKERQQTVSNLDLPKDLKDQEVARIDAETEALRAEMDRTMSNMDAAIASPTASPIAEVPGAAGGAPAPRPAPAMAQPVPRPRGGPAGAPPSPAKLAELKKHRPGSAVRFGDGSVWTLDANGNPQMIQAPSAPAPATAAATPEPAAASAGQP
jgi:hypothetical protein